MKKGRKRQRRILVVDNNQELLSTIRQYLDLHDYQVIGVASGLDALRQLRSETYDILLTDIVMPDISGLGLIEISRKELPGLPIIAMTGYADQVKDLTLERSPDHYLEKPFELTRLLEILESVLAKG